MSDDDDMIALPTDQLADVIRQYYAYATNDELVMLGEADIREEGLPGWDAITESAREMWRRIALAADGQLTVELDGIDRAAEEEKTP